MKAASSTLIALLATGEFVTADLYTITLVGGGLVRLTTADTDVLWDGQTYAAQAPTIDTSDTQALAHLKVGLDVDSWTFAVQPRAIDAITGATWPDLLGGKPWAAAVRNGALDGATVQIDRAYWAAWPDPWGTPLVPVAVLSAEFMGRVADIDIDGPRILVTLNSSLELLTQPVPREVYQAGCRHTLFNAGCTLSAATFACTGAALAGSTAGTMLASVAAPAGSGSFAMGSVVFTSGANAGFSRSVRSWVFGTFRLMSPFPFAIAAGDTFTAYPGCDRTRATCALFGNSINFGGQPLIPVPETAF